MQKKHSPTYTKKITNWLWSGRWDKSNIVIRIAINCLRYIAALFRDISRGQISLHAVSLVYTFLLAIIPVLALGFSLLKGLGVHRNNDVIKLIDQFMQPLGPKGAEITQNILGFVENIRGDLLGLFGVLFLLFISVSLIRKVEYSFNSIWEIGRVKNFAKRITEYIGALIIAPTLMLSALALGTMVSSHKLTRQVSEVAPIGFLLENFGKLVPTILVAGTFTFLYKFIPNARVKLSHAVLGGSLAGVTWTFIGFGFAAFVANSSIRYSAIYSGFAILIMFMIWLYISCLILLLGARLVYYFSHPQHLRHGTKVLALSPLQELGIASEIMLQVSRDFESGSQQWNHEALARYYQLPANNISRILDGLEAHDILRFDDQANCFPGRSPAKISLQDIAQAIFTRTDWPGETRFDPRLKNLLQQSEARLMKELGDQDIVSILATEISSREEE
ncbi:MAG: YihY/virulence factor BrkB family protein [Gammaproteobacteria bacterium]|nr:YihY/virulence factor BrkB family protein [Gammaproteobacteria bacterium]NNM14206.1 YihY/virulence factor BrkB family protein [Gammaproteobacteria bacterium]